MSKQVSMYHNPRCQKSRETLALLRERGVEPELVYYLDEPPSAARVKELVALLGVEPHAILRPKEAAYRELGLSPKSSLAEIARAVAAHPSLLERPIVVAGKRARIGRPPEAVLELF
ncbi:MAG: arsenate reductase (glutaredoxin) [Sorangiineae bacterium]|nr:arsenate reductase (glutaredoxin) [Polyangiaceae bacterium]MEB2323654.1 arsenate reductase (glutaredoxin) [Sorangiineae bacterium]